MPDEQEEALRVYDNEGKAVKKSSDLVNDDKADLHSIADDIGELPPQSSVSTANDENSAAAAGSNGVQTPITTAAASSSTTESSDAHPLRSGFCSSERRYRTAFTNFSPTYTSQAQILQQIATQQYYGYLTANARLYQHFVNSHPSSPLGSPNYLNPQWTPTGVLSMPPGLSPVSGGVPSHHAHHHHWAAAAAASSSSSSPFGTLDPASQKAAAAAACFGFAPWLVSPNVHHHAAVAAAAAQLSPSFLLPVDQISHPGMGAMPFMNFNSPLPSPDFGVPLAPLGAKVGPPQPPHIPFSSLKLSMPGPHPTQFIPHHFGEQTAGPAINHLDAIRQIVPSKASSTFTIGHHGMATQTLIKQENGQCAKNCQQNACCSTSNMSINVANSRQSNCQRQLKESRKHHIKKPLNAFMLYMKQMRQTVMQEADLRERQSAEINKILGKRWHALTKEEQQKYFDMAKKERLDHLKKYPNWSARDNYAIHKKKKKRKDKTHDNSEAKKCRARFGLNQQDQWCKHCKRKKKCLWFKEADSGPESIDTSPPAQVSSTSHGEDENNSNIHHHNQQLLNNGHHFPPNTSSNIETAKYLATLNNIKTENAQNHNNYFGNDSGSINSNSNNSGRLNQDCASVVAATRPLLLTHVSPSNGEHSVTKMSSSSTIDEDPPMIIDGDSADDEGDDFSSDSDSSSIGEDEDDMENDEDNDLRVTVSSSDDEKITVNKVPIPRN